EVDRAGRVKVNPDLSLPGHPEVYVIGDMIALNNLPGVAQVAMQGGKHVAGQIKRRLAGRRTGQPFRYFDKGSMATISRFSAVASIGNRIKFSGFIAWLMWLVVHVMYLIGFKNRFTTMVHWAVSFLFRGRSQRTATRQQIVARTLLARLADAEEELERVRGGGNGDRPSPEEAEHLEGGVVVAESAEPEAHPA
ncbi:MAG TPA: NAD(P)/FAD-dependent oxidoreductase, partial [Propionibacteriaceae bacterium]|nr:NAD(P)/FAD-dependent oxidoreductase [Propionibacteriaceae bacterium]